MSVLRSEKIDALRGWAIFLVVLGHSVIYFPVNIHETSIGTYIYSFCVSLHIPLFFIISGYCYTYIPFSFEYMKKKINRIIVPYFVFNGIDMICRYFMSSVVNRPRGIVASINQILFYGGEYWFLYVLFIVLMIFPIILKLSRMVHFPLSLITSLLFLLNIIEIKCDFLQIGGVFEYLFYFSAGFLLKQIPKEKVSGFFLRMNPYKEVMLIIIWIYLLFFFKIEFLGQRVLVVFVGGLVSLGLTKYSVFIRLFSSVGRISLPIYLLNGFSLVLSRFLICSLLKCVNPLIIIIFNMFIDYYLVSLLIMNVLTKNKVFRVITGDSYSNNK